MEDYKNEQWWIEMQEAMKGFDENSINKISDGKLTQWNASKRNGEKNKGRKHTKEASIKKSLATKGKKHTKEHSNKISNALKGKQKSEIHKKKLSLSKIGKKNLTTSKTNSILNKQKFICEYCNREIGGFANYKRFHSDKCKHKPNLD